MNPVIIIGSGRSGTTIISEIIFRHESLAWPSSYQEKLPAIAEINLLRNLFENRLWRLQGQKPQLNKVSFFNKFLFKPAEAYRFWEAITGNRINFSRQFLLNETATEEEKIKIRKIYLKMIKYQRRKRLAFKITGPARIGYLSSIFPDACFINITRDLFPTVHSWLKVDFWQDKGKNQLWWTGAYTDKEMQWAKENSEEPALLAALQYKKITETTQWEISKHNINCLTIRYEDFVSHPQNTINQILEFAQLEKSNSIINYMKRNKIFDQNKNTELNLFSETDKQVMQQILDGNYIFN